MAALHGGRLPEFRGVFCHRAACGGYAVLSRLILRAELDGETLAGLASSLSPGPLGKFRAGESLFARGGWH
jgi:hypothetical protein